MNNAIAVYFLGIPYFLVILCCHILVNKRLMYLFSFSNCYFWVKFRSFIVTLLFRSMPFINAHLSPLDTGRIVCSAPLLEIQFDR